MALSCMCISMVAMNLSVLQLLGVHGYWITYQSGSGICGTLKHEWRKNSKIRRGGGGGG